MRKWLTTLAVATMALGISDAASAGPQAVHLTKAAIRLKDGEVWGHVGAFFACSVSLEELRWKATGQSVNPRRYSEIFDDELSSAGLKGSNSDSLFDEAPTSGLQLGIVINHVDAQLCAAEDSETGARSYRGKAEMSAEWQLYDPVKAEVVTRIVTTAVGETPNRSRDGVERVMLAAFRANAARLLANDEFRNALQGKTSTSPVSPPRTPMSFSPAAYAAARPVSESSMSVATVLVGGAWGSGFLISKDGYMLTNQHVVGDAAQVRIRWADKTESVADVLRTDKRRDVALLKVDATGHAALPLRTAAMQPGEPVLAIGTPLSKDFQNTITKGIVSSNRTVEGQPFVQSDVAVDHGNSGGPLLDDAGRVVAITDWGYSPDGVSHNLNFFIPIGDALRALSLSAAPEAPIAANPKPTVGHKH